MVCMSVGTVVLLPTSLVLVVPRVGCPSLGADGASMALVRRGPSPAEVLEEDGRSG
jgi:hypothetical protein